MSRAAGPLDAALVQRLRQPGTLLMLLGGPYVWSGERPTGPNAPDPDDYVLTDSDAAVPGTGAAFGQPGEGNTVDVDVWSKLERSDGTVITGKSRILALVSAIAEEMEGAQFALPGFGSVIDGTVRLIATLRDPHAPLMHARLRYVATTRSAVA